MVKVLLIGNGAREHVIAAALARSDKKPEIYAVMKSNNPGIAEFSKQVFLQNLTDKEALGKVVDAIKPDFAIVGPEAPLEAGVVDFLEEKKIGCVGPTKALARLETSKAFTRELMEKYGVPGGPRFMVFKKDHGIKEFMENIGKTVIKPDGLTGGKGVWVQGDHFSTMDEGLAYALKILEEHSAVVVEELLEGEEFSLQSLCDGRTVIDCPVAQDHKRALEDDKGPNTGGMGSYSDANHSLPFLKEEHIRAAHRITEKMAQSLYRDIGAFYKGVMYGGFMVTKDGVKLIEYNARFGDPEAMNVLPIMKTDFVDVCLAMVNGTLDQLDIEFEHKATVCKYVVPKGYPGEPVKGAKVEIESLPEGVQLYYASIDKTDQGLVMTGSRALAFVGIADTLPEAEKLAQSALGAVKGEVFFRNDIGTAALIQKRIDHLKTLCPE